MVWSQRMAALLVGVSLYGWSPSAQADKPTPPSQTTKTSPQKGRVLTPTTTQRLIQCALFKRFGTYQSSQNTIRLGRRQVGMFTSDWDTMLFVYKVQKCIQRHTNASGTSRINVLASLAGLPLYGPKQGNQQSSPWWNHYNPALLHWFAGHIPKPTDTLAGVSYQKLYKHTLQRLVRITAYTYLYLQQGQGKKLFLQYAAAHATPAGQKGRATLEQRLKQRALRTKIKKKLKYLVKDSSIIGTYIEFNPGDAALFLMRRMMGGTAPALWHFLKKILDQYDPSFLPRVTKKKPLGVVTLWAPQKKVYKPSVWDTSQVQQIGTFLANVPPHTRVQLRPGVYRINGSWKLNRARHVIFEGIGKGKVEIISTGLHSPVLSILNAQHVQVRNLHMRHAKPHPSTSCSGQVIWINDSRKVWIDGNELNGSGTVGVGVLTSKDIVITRNYIHSNTQSAIDLFMTGSVAVMYNKIINNAAGITCSKCRLSTGQNHIKNNKVGYLHGRAYATQILKQLKQTQKK